MDVHKNFGALLTAERDVVRARRLVSDAMRDATAAQEDLVPGLRLAERRLVVASRRLTQATWALTRGQPLYEVVWVLPDDL